MTAEEMFWQKVNTLDSDSCWEWKGLRNQWGYGTFERLKNRFRTRRSSRLAYLLTFGEFDNSLQVCHRCDNPPCCNPKHLFLGTAKDNSRDCIEKGRHSRISLTHCKYGHEFSPENTHLTDEDNRVCKICRREAGRLKRLKRGIVPRVKGSRRKRPADGGRDGN